MLAARENSMMHVLRVVEDMVAIAKAINTIPAAAHAALVLVRHYPECGLSGEELATLFLGECIVQGVDSPEILRG
jgi:hypothetical protein